MGVSVYWPLLSVLCVCVCVCDIKSEYQQKVTCVRPHKLDTWMHKTQQVPSGTKAPRPDICRSIKLSKITHQMWLDYPLNQRNKATKESSGWWRLEATGNGDISSQLISLFISYLNIIYDQLIWPSRRRDSFTQLGWKLYKLCFHFQIQVFCTKQRLPL